MSPHIHDNLMLLLDLWLNRREGTLSARSEGVHHAVLFADGAPMTRAHFDLIDALIPRVPLRWQAHPVAGHGNRRRMGALLHLASRQHGLKLTWREPRPAPADPLLSGLLAGLTIPDALHSGDEDAAQRGILVEARALLASGDYARADRALAEALALRLDHPAVLANHAWARLNNPEQDPRQRARDAARMMALAVQLDPSDADVARIAGLFQQAAQPGAARPRGAQGAMPVAANQRSSRPASAPSARACSAAATIAARSPGEAVAMAG